MRKRAIALAAQRIDDARDALDLGLAEHARGQREAGAAREAQHGLAVAEAQREAFPGVELAFDVAHVVGVVEVRARRGCGDRVLEAAELVDEAAFLRLRAGPDAALRDLVDLLGRLVARLGDLADELSVDATDHASDGGFELGREWGTG